MIPNDDKISSIQLGVFIFNTILGVGILTLPANLTKAVGNDGWILAIMSGLVNIIFIYLICKVSFRYRDIGFLGALKRLFGNIPGSLLSIPVLIYFLVFSGFEMRIFAETLKLYLLNKTPLEFIMLPLLILAVVLARTGVEPTARFFEFVTPVILMVVLFLVLVALRKSDFTNLLPMLATPPENYIKGITNTMFAFSGFEILLVLYPFVRNSREVFKVTLIAFVFIMVIYTTTTIQCIVRLGVKETQSFIYPTMSLIKASEVPGGFIERIEGLFISLWVIYVFTTIVALLVGTSIVGGDLLKQKKRKHIIAVILPFVYISAMLPKSIVQVFEMSNFLTHTLGVYTIVVLPILMLLVSSIIREKGGGNADEA